MNKHKKLIGPRDEIEIWDNLVYKGMETNYLISTKGEIKRIKLREKNHPKLVTRYINRDDYLQVQLRINGKYYLPSVHRLVATTFIDIPEKYLNAGLSIDDLEVNHKNGLTFDNYIGNLEWVTSKENTEHAIKNNLRHPKFGSDHPNSVLTEKQVHEICKLLETGMKNVNVARELNVSTTLVTQIKNGLIWKRISSLYNIPTKKKT